MPGCGSGAVVCSCSLLFGCHLGRRQAETPITPLSRFSRPALCQNRSLPGAPGQVGAKPAYEPGGSRCKGGMSSIQASVWNVRTLLRMKREMTNGRHHEEEYRCRSKGRSCP